MLSCDQLQTTLLVIGRSPQQNLPLLTARKLGAKLEMQELSRHRSFKYITTIPSANQAYYRDFTVVINYSNTMKTTHPTFPILCP